MTTSRRTTIVIDPLVHKEAKRLAREADLTFKEFMGHLVMQGVKETALAMSARQKEKIKEEFKQLLKAYLDTL